MRKKKTTMEDALEELRPGYWVWRPKATLYKSVDGPLYEHLRESRNLSAWMREALIAFASVFEVWYSTVDALGKPDPPWQVASVLVKGRDDELAEFIYRLPANRRSWLMRCALWFQMGRMSVGHNLDTEQLARNIVGEMIKQGVMVSPSEPHEVNTTELKEIADVMVGQFL